MGGKRNFHTVRATSAADITLPRGDLYLARVNVVCGATPGAWSYRGANGVAQFPCPSDGTRGRRSFKVKEKVPNVLPSGQQTFTGGITFVELIFSTTAPSEGATFDDMRGILFRRVDAGAVTGNVTVSFDVAPGVPDRVETAISASAGRVVFPAFDSLTPQVESMPKASHLPEETLPAPDYSPANSLTLSVISDGAATTQTCVFY